jgi:protein kinase C substrate 80K-H
MRTDRYVYLLFYLDGLLSSFRRDRFADNPQHCWNGPNRSTTVILACSEENEIWKIMEEEKCVYRMEVGTPAVCEVLGGNGGQKKAENGGKDEL